MNDEPSAQESELQDDRVVGLGLKISAAVVAVALVLVAGVLMIPADEVAPNEEVVRAESLPEVRARAELEIPSLPFRDITDEAGLTFRHENGADGEKLLPEIMGGGGGFLDFDGDGDADIFCVNGCSWPWSERPRPTTSALYENDGKGRFVDVTTGSGLDQSFYGNGAAFGDYDNDGDPDIFVTAVGQARLFRNDGEGKFTDVTDSAGVGGAETDWSTSAGWLDHDLDGDLDLFVARYIRWSREIDLGFDFTIDGTSRAYGRPAEFSGVAPLLYRNDGNGTFTEISETAGLQVKDPNTGEALAKSLGTTFLYANEDKRPDIFVANDTVQNLLYLSQPDGTYQEAATLSGVAFDNSGAARGAMGIDAAAFRNNAQVGVAIGNFANETTALYVCQAPGIAFPVFRDEAISNGIGPVTRIQLTFGILFTDADLDGRLDLFSNNGHLHEEISSVQASQTFHQPPQLLWNCGPEYETEFRALTATETGAEFQQPALGRGASRADIDGDGDEDLLMFVTGGRPRLLRNDQQTGHHWLRLRLKGTQSNRDAIGARIRLELEDGTEMHRVVMPTRSYQSQVELPVTFGLGEHDQVRRLSVIWPSGLSKDYSVEGVDRLMTIQED